MSGSNDFLLRVVKRASSITRKFPAVTCCGSCGALGRYQFLLRTRQTTRTAGVENNDARE